MYVCVCVFAPCACAVNSVGINSHNKWCIEKAVRTWQNSEWKWIKDAIFNDTVTVTVCKTTSHNQWNKLITVQIRHEIERNIGRTENCYTCEAKSMTHLSPTSFWKEFENAFIFEFKSQVFTMNRADRDFLNANYIQSWKWYHRVNVI